MGLAAHLEGVMNANFSPHGHAVAGCDLIVC
jgi:hypothetical protein